MYCTNCGSKTQAGSNYCGNCGAKVNIDDPTVIKYNPNTVNSYCTVCQKITSKFIFLNDQPVGYYFTIQCNVCKHSLESDFIQESRTWALFINQNLRSSCTRIDKCFDFSSGNYINTVYVRMPRKNKMTGAEVIEWHCTTCGEIKTDS